eukprot:TRINITY_DN15026_c0_g1_i1.p1 TRINITY_DN15026_c0_g1~~TRINITY_DN15026_c0_g1_i1.p1  ORF type:complete len:829 (+),score=262.53 TRINITY_DN15026_c0_g1_i1:120-2606(+)
MGIPGLTRQVRSSGTTALPGDTKLYIDGDGWVHAFAGKERKTVLPASNFRAFAEAQRRKFEVLAQRGLQCVVFFDGNSGARKYLTTLSRRSRQWRSVQHGWSGALLHIPMYKRVLKEVLAALGVPIRQCWGEADGEVCAAASRDGAFAVGQDSDFLVMADRYLPLTELLAYLRPPRHGGRRTVRYYTPADTLAAVFPAVKRAQLRPGDAAHRVALAWFATIAGNDYLGQFTARALSWLFGAQRRILPDLIALVGNECVGALDRDITAHAVADALAAKYVEQYGFYNQAHAKSQVCGAYRRELLRCFDAFAGVTGRAAPDAALALPERFVLRYERGCMGSEGAFLVAAGEPATFWHYPLYEQRGAASGYTLCTPVRRRLYAILYAHRRHGSAPFAVVEHGRSADMCDVAQSQVAPAYASTYLIPELPCVWGASRGRAGWAWDVRRALCIYVVQDLLGPGAPIAPSLDAVLKEDELAVAFVVARAARLDSAAELGCPGGWEVNAFVTALLLDREEVDAVTGDALDELLPSDVIKRWRGGAPPSANAPKHNAFLHAAAAFAAAAQTLCLADDVLNQGVLSGSLPVSLNIELAHALHSLFADPSALPSSFRSAPSPFDSPANVEAFLRLIGTAQQVAYGIRIRLEALAACLAYYAARDAPAPPPAPPAWQVHRCSFKKWPKVWAARAAWWPVACGRLTVACDERPRRLRLVVPEGAIALCNSADAAEVLQTALEDEGCDVVNLVPAQDVSFDPSTLRRRLRVPAAAVALVPTASFCHAARFHAPVAADAATAVVVHRPAPAVGDALAHLSEALPVVFLGVPPHGVEPAVRLR